ncbi:hypothetical protein PsorP6_005573 [Peronosclerospora sorghi]|uniref:Uncharacterized protein n=1 Tax=Peronosclerospora sorghi TaxID=230839 RepID=A0ACC0W3H9_9STRA|nr:hypothetical protein PsorP6_005573 [Peronosclerospora sorghi]
MAVKPNNVLPTPTAAAALSTQNQTRPPPLYSIAPPSSTPPLAPYNIAAYPYQIIPSPKYHIPLPSDHQIALPQPQIPSTPIDVSVPAGTPKKPSTGAGRKKSISWVNDAVAPGRSSIQVLLDWLRERGNYDRWRGDTQKAISKESLAGEIVGLLKKKGITHLKNKGLRAKLQELQESYAKASDWKNQTGSGLEEKDLEDGTNAVQVALTKMFKYWDVLHPIMSSRASNNPLATSGTVNEAIPDLLGKNRVVQDDDEFGDHIENEQAKYYVSQLQYVLRIL